MSAFERAVERVLRAEGGYSNDSRDPGQETQWGISKRAYPQINIKTLTRDGAKVIYLRDYWQVCRCEDFPAGLAECVFDAAVNQGVGAAILMLQRALGVEADGRIGPATIAAANRAGDSMIPAFLAERALRYASNPNLQTYGRGWFRRLFTLMNEIGGAS